MGLTNSVYKQDFSKLQFYMNNIYTVVTVFLVFLQ